MMIKENSNLYKEVLANVDEYIYVVNLQDFSIKYISPKLQAVLENNKKKNLPCYSIFGKTNQPCLTCPYSFLSESNESLSLNLYNELLQKQCNHKYIYTKQNDIPYLTVILSPEKAYFHNEDSKRDEMYKVLTNITRILGPNENVTTRLSECLDDISSFYQAEGTYFYQISRKETYFGLNTICDRTFFLEDKDIFNEWKDYFSNNRILKLSQNDALINTQKMAASLKMNELLAVCVKRNNKVTGFLYVVNPKKNLDMTILLSSSAPFIETEFDIDDKTNHLDYLAYTDFMTGIRNRTSFIEEIEKLEKDNNSVGVLFIDINGLKQENDTKGHEAGDRMIKTVASDLQKFFKTYVYRIGGDEFVVFVIDKSENHFISLIEKYKDKMQKTVSVSMGYNWFDNSKDIEKKIASVDELMYAEKKKYHIRQEKRNA